MLFFTHVSDYTCMQCAYACDISGNSIRFVTSRAPRMFFLLLNNCFALGVVVPLLSDPSSLVKFCVATQHAHKSRVVGKELTAQSKSVSKRSGNKAFPTSNARIRWCCADRGMGKSVVKIVYLRDGLLNFFLQKAEKLEVFV